MYHNKKLNALFYILMVFNKLTITNIMTEKKHFAFLILLPPLFAFIHWICVRVYSNFCSPPGFIGLITSIFNTANPFCSYILDILDKTKHFYMNSWVVIGVASVGILNIIFTMCNGQSHKMSSPHAIHANDK